MIRRSLTPKKILLALLFLCATITSSAQKMAVGGSVSAWHNTNDNTTVFSIIPDIGYTLSDKWYIGIGLKYSYSEEQDTKINVFSANPYIRYFYFTTGRIRLFVDSTIGIGMDKSNERNTSLAWQAGFNPGVIFGVTERFSLAAGFGFLGYRNSNKGLHILGNDGWGIDLSGNSLSLGFFYSF